MSHKPTLFPNTSIIAIFKHAGRLALLSSAWSHGNGTRQCVAAKRNLNNDELEHEKSLYSNNEFALQSKIWISQPVNLNFLSNGSNSLTGPNPHTRNRHPDFSGLTSLQAWSNIRSLRFVHFLLVEPQFLESFPDCSELQRVKMAHEVRPSENVGWANAKTSYYLKI